MAPITVAVAGATGLLGKPIVRALLSPQYYPKEVGRVIFFTRDPNSPASQELKALGGEPVQGSISADLLKGVDVLVNSLAGHSSPDLLNEYAKAAVDAGVKVYFPTEFGFDHRNTAIKHDVFNTKQVHEDYARQIGGDKLKVVVVYTALFLDSTWAFGPYLGFDWKNRVFTAVGSPKTKVTFVHTKDIASSVARLSILAVQNPSSVPDRLRISGDAVSTEEFAEIFTKESGDKVEVKVVDAAEFNANLKPENFAAYLQALVGEGADYSKGNSDELVNPGESLWKWTKLSEFVKETKGSQWN